MRIEPPTNDELAKLDTWHHDTRNGKETFAKSLIPTHFNILLLTHIFQQKPNRSYAQEFKHIPSTH